MRTKTLLFLLLLSCGVLNAQDTIKTLVITEARLDDARHSYVEITNMGTTAVNLSQFELGQIGAWTVAYQAGAGFWVMLPDRELAPGKSFVAAAVYDWNPKMWLKDPDHFSRILNKKEFWTLADLKFHFPESPVQPNALDSVTPHYHILETWNGRDCIYLRQHISATDSVVVDQVNGVFANADGTRGDPKGAIDVAGVTNATNEATLIRKFSVKKGNTDFETGRGQDAAESEWMPVPLQLGHWEMMRTLFWTVGNHGDYNLDPSTITSSTIDIGWADSTLVVPWGIRNDDSIMSEFVKKPGIAWHYAYAKNYADSAHISARTGDILTLYAAGNDLDMINFKITVADPTVDANLVMPMRVKNADGFYAGMGAMYMVSANKNGVMDTIQGDYRGIGYASRVDTLFKYLEKAPKATWEIVWVDGKIRTDLKSGDILKVTAENGDVKNYFIKVDNYRPSHNAYLSSITWPDIPEEYKGIFGWLGDTIPNFVPTKYDFKVQVPADVPGIPALVGKNEDVNGKNVVSRAKNLTGGPEDRTITFTSTAEDDTTIRTYNVLLEKEKNPADLQPWSGEPFISQLVWNEQWANTFMEIANPGNQVLDMSNYMICSGYNVTSPVTAITSYALPADWPERYRKYIPGYKWKDQAGWSTDPAIAVQDLNVNPLVQGGDVFVLGDIRGTGQSGYPWWASQQCDIDFGHNPWGDDPTTIDGDAALNQWNLGTWFLFRIDNDSVKLGLKPATDPNDFTLLDVFGSGDGTIPVIGGLQLQQINGYTRKPEIYTGKPEFKGSFGTDEATSEWIFRDRAYYDARNVGWPNDILFVADGLGSHFMNDVTIFKSTVSSNTLKISEGFTSPQTIRGVVTDTTVNGFFAYIIKADTGQTLSVKSATNGSIRALTDAVINGDTLIVKSADKKNITKYVVTVTDEGLSSDAVLTSADYTVEYQGETGSVKGFDYGTLLKTVVSKVTVPANATMTVIDAKGAYVPYKTLNFDTLYVDLKVNNQMFLDVVAENGVTRIVYQLMPNALETDAFVTSDVFEVDQEASLIDLVPDGIATGPLMNNLVPAPGATMMLFDKFGYDRMFGRVMKDDKLVVTAMDGETTRTYYLQMLGDISLSLAYVLSDVYAVNQLDYTIWGYFDESTSVADFIANLIPATGANVKVTDADGVENTGNLVMGDKLVVTSGNGVNTVTYDITFPTDINNQNQHSINVYPNPASDRVTISGLMSGNRIRVNNIMGVVVIDKTAQMDKEVLSLQGQRFGIYFITVSNADGVVGRYKLILK
jgi:hypothetical protein